MSALLIPHFRPPFFSFPPITIWPVDDYAEEGEAVRNKQRKRLRFISSNDRTERCGRLSAFAWATDVARPRSLQ